MLNEVEKREDKFNESIFSKYFRILKNKEEKLSELEEYKNDWLLTDKILSKKDELEALDIDCENMEYEELDNNGKRHKKVSARKGHSFKDQNKDSGVNTKKDFVGKEKVIKKVKVDNDKYYLKLKEEIEELEKEKAKNEEYKESISETIASLQAEQEMVENDMVESGVVDSKETLKDVREILSNCSYKDIGYNFDNMESELTYLVEEQLKEIQLKRMREALLKADNEITPRGSRTLDNL